MKQIFIAANWERREEVKELAETMESVDLYVKADWIYEKEESNPDLHAKHCVEMAYQDLRDVRDCDVFVRLADDLSPKMVPSYLARGARMFEQGIAFGLGKEIYVVGGVQMIYDYMPRVQHVQNKLELLAVLCPQIQ